MQSFAITDRDAEKMLATIAAVIVVLDPDGLAKICEFDSDRREQFFSGAPGIAV